MNTTLITGASSGIGAAFARKLAARGRNVLLVARSEDKLIALCNELGRLTSIRAQYVALDLQQPDAAAQLFEETKKRELEIDMLINNAGFGSMGDFVKLDLERELDMIELNIRAAGRSDASFSAADARTKARHDHQCRFDRRFSGGALHGDVRSDESICAFVFRSALGREPPARRSRDGAVSRRDGDKFLRSSAESIVRRCARFKRRKK